MPINPKDYADNWNDIALQVKTAANWTCQNCDRPCRRPGELPTDFQDRLTELAQDLVGAPCWVDELFETIADDELGLIEKPKYARFILTVAHLDQNLQNNAPENLKALCSVCHLHHDRPHRMGNTYRKRERNGQLSLEL